MPAIKLVYRRPGVQLGVFCEASTQISVMHLKPTRIPSGLYIYIYIYIYIYTERERENHILSGREKKGGGR